VIPIRDDNPTRRRPVVTMLLIAGCVFMWFGVQQQQADNETAFTYERAAIPCELVTGEPVTEQEVVTNDCTRNDVGDPIFPDKSVLLSLFTSMFLHGGLLHLGGNMLYLWVFGNNIEDATRPWWYLLFYLSAGVVATLTHVALQPESTVPLVGASGAIAGVMGAYLVLFPRVQIRTFVMFFLIMLRDIEARWLLGFWFVSQFFINPNSGVAWGAHVGGFVFGVLVGLVWRARRRSVGRGDYPFRPSAVPPYA
jgi:membrane associated rhomboid family serine protease